jgi:hypothetical protein
MGVLARRLGCYVETGDAPPQPSAGKHAPWPRFCESTARAFLILLLLTFSTSCTRRSYCELQND